MGVLLNLTKEYFHEVGRAEEATVLRVDFTDKNGVFHKKGYRVDGGSPEEMAEKLIELIEQLIEERGSECDLNDIDVSNITRMNYEYDGEFIGVFQNSDFNGDISGWDVSNVENMSHMFNGAMSFNQPIGNWDVINVEDMSWMFCSAYSFNKPLKDWGDKLDNVKNMERMFDCATSFDQDLSGWKLNKDCKIEDMFYLCSLEDNPPVWYKKRVK